MIKLTLNELTSAIALINILSAVEDKTLTQGYWLARMLKVLAPEYDIYLKSITELHKKYGKLKDGEPVYEEGKLVFKSKKDEEGFKAEYDKWMETEIEVTFDPINLSIFDGLKYKGPSLTVMDKLFKIEVKDV